MPVAHAAQALRQLYSVEPSSPDLLRVLYALIRIDENEQYSSDLEEEELTRLVDFLDNVRIVFLAPRPITNEISKALFFVDTSDDIFRRCLRKFQSLHNSHTTKQPSHIISGDLTRIGESAIAYGGFADVWQGDQGGKRVCIKVLRIPLNDTGYLKKVRIRLRRITLSANDPSWAL